MENCSNIPNKNSKPNSNEWIWKRCFYSKAFGSVSVVVHNSNPSVVLSVTLRLLRTSSEIPLTYFLPSWDPSRKLPRDHNESRQMWIKVKRKSQKRNDRFQGLTLRTYWECLSQMKMEKQTKCNREKILTEWENTFSLRAKYPQSEQPLRADYPV